MSTIANNTPIAELIAQYEAECCDFTDLKWAATAAHRYVQTMEDSQVRCLLHTLACAITKVPEPEVVAVENPNVLEWRPLIDEALRHAMLQFETFGHPSTSSTSIRRSAMKNGGKKIKLGMEFETKSWYGPKWPGSYEPLKFIQDHINRVLTDHGHPKAVVRITTGSQLRFKARIIIEGDDDYENWARVFLSGIL